MRARWAIGLVGTLLAVTLAAPAGATPSNAERVREVAARSGATLSIPRLGLVAPVLAVGRTSAGDLQVPADIHKVGWDTFSAPIGAAHGGSLVAGHLNNDANQRGALWRLSDLRNGDIVRVTDHGHTYRYKISRRILTSADRPLPAVATRLTGPPRLALSTCTWPLRRESDGLLHFARRLTVIARMVHSKTHGLGGAVIDRLHGPVPADGRSGRGRGARLVVLAAPLPGSQEDGQKVRGP